MTRRFLHSSLLGLLAVLSQACSGKDNTVIIDLEMPAEPDPGETPPPVDEEPLYAISASLFGEEGNTSYVALLPSLESDVEIDYSRTLEVGSASTIFGPDQGALFAVGLDETPTVTKYEVTASERFVERETIDFSGYGITYMWRDPGLVPFLSQDKAYVIDDRELQVVIWNPDAMEIDGSFSLADVADPDYPRTRFEADPTFRGDELLVLVTHSTEDDEGAPYSSLISIDTVNDRVTSIVREERCGGLWESVEDSKGDIYFSSGTWDAAQNRVFGSAIETAPCIVRVKAGASEFDPDYFLDSASIGSSPAGGLVSGGGDVAYIKVLDETALPPIDEEDFDAVWGGENWQWFRFQLGSSAAATPVTSLPLSNGGGGELIVESRSYVRNASADFASTTLLDMGAQGEPVQGLTLRGYPYGIVRVR
ncbi:MAG: hypothetical protein ABW217_05170 [Polyangiaceae bacterium]